MPKDDNKVLKYNHGEKSIKVSFIIYDELESLLGKMSTCHTNPKKSSTAKINKHIAPVYSLFIEAWIYEKLLSEFKRACNKKS